MTQQEYEQKKRECWQEFYKKYPYHITLSSSIIFAETFDRAYALGKQETKQEIKQEKPTCTDDCASPRLQIAAQLLAALLVSDKEKYPVSRALGLADFLIDAEKRRPK